jgi:choline kinase
MLTKAIILAAGSGSRLRPLTDACPKCLLDVGGHAIIDRQVEALTRFGVTDIVVVVGYLADEIRKYCGHSVRYIDNTRFAATNSLYSLWLARHELTSGTVVLNSDVLVPALLIERLLLSPAPDAILVERGNNFLAEDMKVTLRGEEVVDFGKGIPPERAHAHNVGIAKFSASGGRELVSCLDQLVASGHENDWAPRAFLEFGRWSPLIAVPTNGLPWIEIDYADDLERARLEIEPAIAALEASLAAQ